MLDSGFMKTKAAYFLVVILVAAFAAASGWADDDVKIVVFIAAMRAISQTGRADISAPLNSICTQRPYREAIDGGISTMDMESSGKQRGC
jgi:hypothetical protein